MLNERSYPMSIDENGDYHIQVSKTDQSIFKMKGTSYSNQTEKITWRTKDTYYWSDGMRTDVYPIVNPSSYTKDGVGYSMVGFLPEMKEKMVVIYGHYYDKVDSIRVFLK